MSGKISQYPISVLLQKMIERFGPSRSGFVRTLGYRKNVESGLARLTPWLEHGEGFWRIIKNIAAVYPDQAQALEAAIQKTKSAKAAEAEAAFLEHCKAEAATFIPFIHAEGEFSVPRQITFFALCGGHRRWTTIRLPAEVLKLPVEEQLPSLRELMLDYKRKFNGHVPFFGRLIGFKYVRLIDFFQFDAEGRLLAHLEKPFRHGECRVELR